MSNNSGTAQSDGTKVSDQALTDVTDYKLDEIGIVKDDWGGLATGDYNPDNISISTYVRMLTEDAQVGAGASLFKLALMSRPWDIKFPEGEEPDNAEEIIAFLKWNFENVNRTIHYRGGLRNVVDEMLEGPMLGFMVAEPVFDMGKYKGDSKVILRKLKVLPQETITFYSDKYGNLTKIEQTAAGEVISLEPLWKFIVWPFQMRAGNWYGRALLKRAYKHWYIKEFLMKKWNIYLERKAVPILLGKTRAANIKNLQKLLTSTNEKTALTVANEDDVDVVQVKEVGNQFKTSIQYHDTMIFRGMLTPTLLLGQEDVGARALGDTHFQVFMWVVDKMKEDLNAIMNGLLVGLTKFNFPSVEIMPEFVIPELSTEDRDKFSKVVKDMVDAGVLHPDENWIRQRLGFPLVDKSSLISPDGEIPPQTEERPETDTEEEDKVLSSSSSNTKQMLREYSDYTMPDLTTNLKTRIAPEKIKAMMDISENRGFADLKQYVESFSKTIIEQSTKLLEGYDPSTSQRYDYLTELKKLKAPKDTVMAGMILDIDKGFVKEVSDYYVQKLETAEIKRSRTKQFEGFNMANSDILKVLKERAFTSSGVLNSALLEMGRNALISGIQSGLTIEQMMDDLELSFSDYSENRLRTIVRTNIAAAANMGAVEVMRNTAGFVNGVMYQAILDERTTPFCEDHNGETLPVNDPRVDAMTPPNHYQCRSYWVPVTILDSEIDTNTWNDDGPAPSRGFGMLPEGGV